MGIPGLTRALEAYGTSAVLTSETVVIDGPALVHQLWAALSRTQTVESIMLGQLSYSFIGQQVAAWLDELTARKVHVRKIYFDGFLPPWKKPERLKRLRKESRISSQTSGLLPNTTICQRKAHLDDFEWIRQGPKALKRSGDWLPKPPFLVPAVIESLRQSQRWGSIVEMVPGEADVFCALDVRGNKGIVITSDSDLLIQDLGPDGHVVFLKDIDFASDEVRAKKFSTLWMEEDLGIRSLGGMQRLAYEFSTIHGLNLRETLANMKNETNPDTSDPSSYQEFLVRLSLQEYIPNGHPVLAALSDLDPRISEFVLQCVGGKRVIGEELSESQKSGVKLGREFKNLSMFLPIMVEHQDMKNPWSMSEPVRQLAYGVAQPVREGSRRSTVIEYRSTGSGDSGTVTDIPSVEQTEEMIAQLVDLLGKLGKTTQDKKLRWIALAIYLDAEYSLANDKQPLSVKLLYMAAEPAKSNPEKNYRWETVHFTAQVQATLYSLRMLKQALGAAKAGGLEPPELSKGNQELSMALFELIEISGYPIVPDMDEMLMRFGKTQGLGVIGEILGQSDLASRLKKKEKKRKKMAEENGEDENRQTITRKAAKAHGTNPFALLEED